MMRRWVALGATLVASLGLSGDALAEIDPNCVGEVPADYNEYVQQDFLLNYIALASTFSPIHGPVPHDPGRGFVGVELAVIPPLSCARRYALGGTKTEDTNKSPILPRFRASYSFSLPLAKVVLVPYAGVGYTPPVPVAGTQSVVISAEAGAGMRFGRVQVGARMHATMQKTIADAATGFAEDDPSVLDFYSASTFGADLMGGYRIGGTAGTEFTPYAAVGITDVSTFFWIGDDGTLSNNFHPYLGPNFSVGVDGLVLGRLRWGGEFYMAPGGHRKMAPEYGTVSGFGTYGNLYTFRMRVGIEL